MQIKKKGQRGGKKGRRQRTKQSDAESFKKKEKGEAWSHKKENGAELNKEWRVSEKTSV